MFRIGESLPSGMSDGGGVAGRMVKEVFSVSFCHQDRQKELFTKRDMLYEYARTGVRRVTGLYIYSFLTRGYTFMN